MTRSGIDLTALDPDVRPQDDLYAHVNGRWLAAHEIPADRAMDGAFRALHDQAEEQVRDIIADAGAVRRGGDVHRPRRGQGRRRVRVVHGHRRRRGRRHRAAAHRPRARRGGDRRRPSSPGRWARCSAPAAGGAVGFYVDNDAKEPDAATSCTSRRAAWACPTRPTTATSSTRRCSRPTARTSPACCASAAPRRTRRRPTSSPAASWPSRPRWPPGTGTSSRTATPTSPTTPLTLTELAERAPGFDWHSWVLALGAPGRRVRPPRRARAVVRRGVRRPVGERAARGLEGVARRTTSSPTGRRT